MAHDESSDHTTADLMNAAISALMNKARKDGTYRETMSRLDEKDPTLRFQLMAAEDDHAERMSKR
jgi:hypothetical protein